MTRIDWVNLTLMVILGLFVGLVFGLGLRP
jgi:hypothetical protein